MANTKPRSQASGEVGTRIFGRDGRAGEGASRKDQANDQGHQLRAGRIVEVAARNARQAAPSICAFT